MVVDIFLRGVLGGRASFAQEREDAAAAETPESVLGLVESLLLAANDVLPDTGLGTVAEGRQEVVAEVVEALAGTQMRVRKKEAEEGERRAVVVAAAEVLRGQLEDLARGPREKLKGGESNVLAEAMEGGRHAISLRVLVVVCGP